MRNENTIFFSLMHGFEDIIPVLFQPPDEHLASNGTDNERFMTSGFLIADQNSFVRSMADSVIISAGSQLQLQGVQVGKDNSVNKSHGATCNRRKSVLTS